MQTHAVTTTLSPTDIFEALDSTLNWNDTKAVNEVLDSTPFLPTGRFRNRLDDFKKFCADQKLQSRNPFLYAARIGHVAGLQWLIKKVDKFDLSQRIIHAHLGESKLTTVLEQAVDIEDKGHPEEKNSAILRSRRMIDFLLAQSDVDPWLEHIDVDNFYHTYKKTVSIWDIAIKNLYFCKQILARYAELYLDRYSEICSRQSPYRANSKMDALQKCLADKSIWNQSAGTCDQRSHERIYQIRYAYPLVKLFSLAVQQNQGELFDPLCALLSNNLFSFIHEDKPHMYWLKMGYDGKTHKDWDFSLRDYPMSDGMPFTWFWRRDENLFMINGISLIDMLVMNGELELLERVSEKFPMLTQEVNLGNLWQGKTVWMQDKKFEQYQKTLFRVISIIQTKTPFSLKHVRQVLAIRELENHDKWEIIYRLVPFMNAFDIGNTISDVIQYFYKDVKMIIAVLNFITSRKNELADWNLRYVVLMEVLFDLLREYRLQEQEKTEVIQKIFFLIRCAKTNSKPEIRWVYPMFQCVDIPLSIKKDILNEFLEMIPDPSIIPHLIKKILEANKLKAEEILELIKLIKLPSGEKRFSDSSIFTVALSHKALTAEDRFRLFVILCQIMTINLIKTITSILQNKMSNEIKFLEYLMPTMINFLISNRNNFFETLDFILQSKQEYCIKECIVGLCKVYNLKPTLEQHKSSFSPEMQRFVEAALFIAEIFPGETFLTEGQNNQAKALFSPSNVSQEDVERILRMNYKGLQLHAEIQKQIRMVHGIVNQNEFAPTPSAPLDFSPQPTIAQLPGASNSPILMGVTPPPETKRAEVKTATTDAHSSAHLAMMSMAESKWPQTEEFGVNFHEEPDAITPETIVRATVGFRAESDTDHLTDSNDEPGSVVSGPSFFRPLTPTSEKFQRICNEHTKRQLTVELQGFLLRAREVDLFSECPELETTLESFVQARKNQSRAVI